MKKVSRLLYIEEHLGCDNYIKENNVGFSKHLFEKEKTYRIELEKEFAVLFVMTGKLDLGHNEKTSIQVSKHEIILLTNFMNYKLTAKTDATVTIMYFDRPNSRCDLLALDRMADSLSKADNSKIKKIVMKKPMVDFINHMSFYLDEKMFCRHLHDIKETEFFFVIRGFYTKDEIAYFFAPVIKSLNDFTNMVHANYLKADTVEELAEALNMTQKTFTRKFKTVFEETPKQWMMREKAKYSMGIKKTKKGKIIVGLAR